MADTKLVNFPTPRETLSKDNSGATKNVVGDTLDSMSTKSSFGRVSNVMADSWYGINHRKTPGAVPINKDDYGFTFFTRPGLNLTTENISFARQLTPLLTEDEFSQLRLIRNILDPFLSRHTSDAQVKCRLIDEANPFINILSNNLLSINGWPDRRALYSQSHEGMYKETFTWIDGPSKNYGSYEITANFRNIPGNPIALLFDYWFTYACLNYEGALWPYFDFVRNNEKDYNTRIYRIVTDPTRTYVTGLAACGAGFPVSSPMGAIFNYESSRPYNDGYDQVSISFMCDGAEYNDPILIKEFNAIVSMFNPAMGSQSNRNTYFVKLDQSNSDMFKYRVYPRIDPYTYELEWWVPREDYNSIMNQVNSYNSYINAR